MTQRLAWTLWLAASLTAAPAAATQRLYFNNHRVIDAAHHEVKGAYVYVTLRNGAVVVMKATDIDWEGTKRLAEPGMELRGDIYWQQQAEAEAAATGAPSVLSTNDLKNAHVVMRRKAASSRETDMRVYGSQTWTDTAVEVGPSLGVSVRASGRVTVGPNLALAADGRKNQSGDQPLEPSLPYGALIGKIGPDGDAFLVGPTHEIRASSQRGTLHLSVNDAATGDNAGAFDVHLTPMPLTRGHAFTVPGGTAQAPASSAPAASQSASPRVPAGHSQGMGRGIGQAKTTRGAAEARGAAAGEDPQ